MVQSADLGGAPGGAWHRAGGPSPQPSADHHRDLSRGALLRPELARCDLPECSGWQRFGRLAPSTLSGQLKRVVTDGIIGDPTQQTVVAPPPSESRKEQ